MIDVTPEYKDLVERCRRHLKDLREYYGRPPPELRIKESETVLPFTRSLVEDRIEEIMTGRVR